MRELARDDRRPAVAREMVLDLISRTSFVPREVVTGQESLRELGFDSLRHFQLMLEIERIVDRDLEDGETETILCCATVDDVCTVLTDMLDVRQ